MEELEHFIMVDIHLLSGPRHFIGPERNMKAFEFLNKIVPMRHIKKMNYSYQQQEDMFGKLSNAFG